jgi:hypothetical protein
MSTAQQHDAQQFKAILEAQAQACTHIVLNPATFDCASSCQQQHEPLEVHSSIVSQHRADENLNASMQCCVRT